MTWKPIEFWIAVAIAVIVKMRASPRLGPFSVLSAIVVAVGAAYVASPTIAEYMHISENVAAAFTALVAESAMRLVLTALDNPHFAIKLWKEWKE